MTPSPQVQALGAEARGMDGERVVISGFSGLYPGSQHVKDFERILYNKENPVNDENIRWSFVHPDVRDHTGKIPHLSRFDGQFFKVSFVLGNSMDPMSKKCLEQTYQAIYDAGVNPATLSGKKVAVFIGTCFSETEKSCFYVSGSKRGLGIAGCNKAMFANRISYWLNAKGPSMSIDDSCCSSLAALEQAYLAISRGECEAAVVGGANICLHPHSSVHYSRIMTLSRDGKTKSFDKNAEGCAKSEAVVIMFLQKAKDAKRIHAELVHVMSEFTHILQSETGPRYGFDRNPRDVAAFLRYFYQKADVDPGRVEYVEAFGAAIPEADKAELDAIEEVFCKNRSNPLLVGSVMSNIGYGEAASGLSAISKVLLAYHNGKLASNLHCESPRRDVPALQDGRMQIVTEHQEFHRSSYAAVNGIAVTGVNAHVLLRGLYKPKDLNRYKSPIPHLVTISARQDTAVQRILDDLKSRPIDPEELALFHNIHQESIAGHLGRGYSILCVNDEGQTVSLSETVNYFDDAKRPLWFVYSGMGSQWPGMGAQLMRIPVFAAAIERCHKVLEPKGVDIVHIITSQDKTIFDNILHSFVGIAAIQIGLTDVLTSLGIVPDKIIGHSVGELGCAYADGCFTAEEMILSAYSRGLVSVQTPFIRGSMAAVGIGYQQVVKLIPPEIEVACHNSGESSTISGPADVMKEFVAQLTGQGIFAKEVPSSNIAYHSRYIAEAGPGLLKYLSEVIKHPKPRSDRWVSTSVPEKKWNEPQAKFSSAYYHTNNLLSPVLFEEAINWIPSNAVLVEVAPHGLLQAILKRALPESCKNIPLTRRGHADNALMVLDAVGKIYMEGHNPKVQALYPQVEFPVSTETPFLSHLVEWAHQEKWKLLLHLNASRMIAAASKIVISLQDKEHSFLQGHVLRGKNVYPWSAALVAAWDTLAMSLGQQKKQLSVQFRDLELFAQPIVQDRRPLRLSVNVQRGSGRFEILESRMNIVMTGFINADLDGILKFSVPPLEPKQNLDLTSEDIYQMFHDMDYFYGGDFRSIHKANDSFTEGQIIWNGNWVTFLDGIIQMSILNKICDNATVSSVRSLCISLKEHQMNEVIQTDGKDVMLAEINETLNVIRCGGVVLNNVQYRMMPSLPEIPFTLKSLEFIPRFEANIDTSAAWQVYLQIVAENINKNKIHVLHIQDKKHNSPVFDNLKNILGNIPGLEIHYEVIQRDKNLIYRDQFLSKVDLILIQNLASDDNLCQLLYRVLRLDTFLINAEEKSENIIRPSPLYSVQSAHTSNGTKLELIKWRPTHLTGETKVVTVGSPSELSMLKTARLDPTQRKLVILTGYPPVPGLKELVKLWRSESEHNLIYLAMVHEQSDLHKLPEFNLAYNILIDGKWGGEYHIFCGDNVSANRGVALRCSRVTGLDSFHWVEAKTPIGSGVDVNVHYAAINEWDVKKATGLVPLSLENDTAFCMDFSGVTDSGDRVMGIVASGAASVRVKARPELLWPVPAHWSLEDAATVPSAYAHAIYCFDMKVKFSRGFRVLVLGAAGALGQAVISVALAHGCEVFATVSDIRKKRFLMKLFPELKEDHIGNSRDSSFGDMVRILTKDVGCDIAFSCARGEDKNVVLSCLGSRGVMLDVNQLETKDHFSFGMYYLTKERSYVPVSFPSLLETSNIKDLKRIQTLISEGIARGYVRPLSRVSYEPPAVSRAVRLVAASRHRGRVLINLRGQLAAVKPRLSYTPTQCQLVICGEQAFGIQWAERLIKRGAKRIHLHGSQNSNITRMKLEQWDNNGVKVQTSAEDLSYKGIVSLLTQCSRLGPVEGIYVVATGASDPMVMKLNEVIANLDVASREVCPSVRYFAVISIGISIGLNISVERTREYSPVTLVNLTAFKTYDNMGSSQAVMSWRDAVNITEQALRSSRTCLQAVPDITPPPSLLEQLATVADIKMWEEMAGDTSLLDLRLDTVKVPAICSFLRDSHNLVLAEDSIPTLTVKKIEDLEKMVYGFEPKQICGLETFFSYVDPDELMATNEIVFPPTLTRHSNLMFTEFDVNEPYLFIVPGMEGHHKRFELLCERLKVSALVLQPGLDHLGESLRETAERYTKMLLNKACVRNGFYLLGYETGVIVALEMAAIFEELGMTGTVFCVGSAPEELKGILEDNLQDIPSEEALQDAVVRHMFKLMTGNANTDELDDALIQGVDWKDKVDACVRTLLGKLAHSAQYTRSLMEAAYLRIKQSQSFRENPCKLKSRLVLLQAALESKVSPVTSLQRYSQQPVVVYKLRETFAHATQDLRCSAIINAHLDAQVLQAFDGRNLCDSYVLRPDMLTAVEI